MGKINKLTIALFALVGILLVGDAVVGVIKITGKNKEPDKKPEKTQEASEEPTKESTKAPKETEPEETTTEAPKMVEVIYEDFEGDVAGFRQRGSETVEVVEGGYNSEHCLSCHNRTEYWHGALWDSQGQLVGGDTIEASAMVKFSDVVDPEDPEAKSLDFDVLEITLEFDSEGSTKWPQMGMIKVEHDTWIELTGTYTLPDDATNVHVYVEAERLEDLYVDNFRVSKLSK